MGAYRKKIFNECGWLSSMGLPFIGKEGEQLQQLYYLVENLTIIKVFPGHSPDDAQIWTRNVGRSDLQGDFSIRPGWPNGYLETLIHLSGNIWRCHQ